MKNSDTAWPPVRDEEAATCPRHMEKVYQKNDRGTDWQALLNRLRATHKTQRWLMGVLDTLSNKKLIDSAKRGGR